MSKRIKITESQLRYIIENVNRIDEQKRKNEKEVSTSQNTEQWIYNKLMYGGSSAVFNKKREELGLEKGEFNNNNDYIMRKLQIDSAKDLWNHPKVDPDSKTMAIKVIDDAFAKYGRDKIEESNKHIFLYPGKVITKETESSIVPFEVTVDNNADTKNPFKPFDDNKATISADVVASLQSTLERIKAMEADGYKVSITAIGIETSSSRLRNTGSFEGNTWAQLSQARANSAWSQIQSIFSGYKLPDPIVDATGLNKDGSSGKEVIYVNDKIKTGGEPQNTDSTKPEYTHPDDCQRVYPNDKKCGTLRSSLNKYKYIHIFIKGEAVKEPIPTEDYTIPFIISFKTEQKEKPSISTPPKRPPGGGKIKSKPIKFKATPDECPRWGGKNYGGIATKIFATPTSQKKFPTGNR